MGQTSRQPRDQRDDEQHQEYQKQYPGDSHRCSLDPCEPEQPGDDRND